MLLFRVSVLFSYLQLALVSLQGFSFMSRVFACRCFSPKLASCFRRLHILVFSWVRHCCKLLHRTTLCEKKSQIFLDLSKTSLSSSLFCILVLLVVNCRVAVYGWSLWWIICDNYFKLMFEFARMIPS